MSSIREHTLHFLRRRGAGLADVRPGEAAAVLLAFAYFFFMLCSYYLLRPLRDAMGVESGMRHLPWLFTATFMTMLALVPVFGAVAGRWPPLRFIPLVYRFFALNMLGFGLLFFSGVARALGAQVFFVWLSVFNLFAVSIFWSAMADRFSNEQGKRLFGLIAAGGTAGALAGPALAALLATRFPVALLAALAAVLLELAVQCFLRLARRQNFDAAAGSASREPTQKNEKSYALRVGGGWLAGITLIARDSYLLGIVLYLLLHSLASTFLYLEQMRIVAAALSDTASRTQLFALVDLTVSLTSLVLQLAVTGPLLKRFGVAAALMLLPVASLAAFGALAWWPVLAVLITVQGARRAIDYAIARPARETLFTVVGREAKYKAKSVIETVVYRGGDAASGWLFALVAAAGIGFAGIAALFAPLTAGWLLLSRRLAAKQQKRAQMIAPAADVPSHSYADQQRNLS